jgi:hypothetical protein
MLAYIFWHWPRPGLPPRDYEDRLEAFHAALSRSPSAAFSRSVVFRAGRAPWLPEDRTAYVDWYLLDGSAGLDPLNEAAVAGGCRLPHDEAARHVEGASAGLYRLRIGEPRIEEARRGLWFNKTAGVPQARFLEDLRASTARDAGMLWVRQMGLGSTPEFCLLSPGEARLPPELAPCPVPLDLVLPRTH